MRAATRKICHWIKRKQEIPVEAMQHSAKMAMKKKRRVRVRELVQRHWKGRINDAV